MGSCFVDRLCIYTAMEINYRVSQKKRMNRISKFCAWFLILKAPLRKVFYMQNRAGYLSNTRSSKITTENILGGRWPSVEDNLQWKMTLHGRWPSVEDDLWWKTAFDGRQPSVEDNLWWNITFFGGWPSVGRWPAVEDDLWLKTTMGERQPLVKDDLRWKTTFGQRRPSLDPCILPTPLCGNFGQ